MQIKYGLKLSFKTLLHYRKRFLLTLFGVTFALMLLFANSIWQDTSEEIVLDQTLDSVDYLFATTSFLKEGTYNITDYFDNEELIERYDTSIVSNAVFNKGNKTGEYRYYPLGNQEDQSDPVDVITALYYSLEGMPNLGNVLDIVGRAPSASDEMMISSIAQLELERVYNITIDPGYKLNVSLGQRYPATDQGEFQLKHFDLIDYENITITGIYRYNGAVSITQSTFNLGIFDRSVIFPFTDETLTEQQVLQMDRNTLFRHFLVTFDRETLLDAGIIGVEEILSTLANRVKSRFWHSINKFQSETLDTLNIEYQFSFNASFLYYPLIILSLLLTHYAIGLLISGRDEQLNVLRTRGANDLDITMLFSFEFLIVVASAVLIGGPLAIGFSLLIPALDTSGIDMEIINAFIDALSINFDELFEVTLMIAGVLLGSFIYHVFRTIFYPRLDINFDVFKFIHIGATILLGILFTTTLIDITEIIDIEEDRYIPNIRGLLREAILLLSIVWLLFSQILAELVIFILKLASGIYQKLLHSVSYFLERTYKRPQARTKVLAFYFIFIFSLLVFASSLYATYQTFDDQTEEFLQGGDFRIHTQLTPSSYSDHLMQIDGIKSATGVYKTNVYIGNLEYTVYGVDPARYMEIGYWQYANNSEEARQSISTLMDPDIPYMIVSDFLQDKLDFELYETVSLIGLATVYNSEFIITDTIDTAPGLGLAGYQNPELDQPTTAWMIVNINYLERYYPIGYTNIYLASMEEGYNKEDVTTELEKEEAILQINPVPINQNFIGVFVSKYLPNPRYVLFFVILAVALIGTIIISMTTDFILHERRQEFALMIAIGGTRKRIARYIYTEIFAVATVSLLLGIIYGLFMSRLSLVFYIPFTLRRLFVALTFGLNWVLMTGLTVFFLLMIFIVTRRSIKQALPANITDSLLRG